MSVFKGNRLTKLFQIERPIIQAGMVWASGWRLASAVSNHGGLGIIGSGSMKPEILREHIRQCKSATSKPFAVNVPLMLPTIKEQIDVILEEKVPIVFSSAGNPKSYTKMFQDNGMKVVHVVSSSKFAAKAQAAGCDAVVAEGFEAGGHNGREETTTLVLLSGVCEVVRDIPVIAAGGIHNGRSMLSAMVLGAEGVQIGTRFVASVEGSSHDTFKQAVLQATEGDTKLMLKTLTPVRLLRNDFFYQVQQLEDEGRTAVGGEEEQYVSRLRSLLGKGRSRIGMFEGNLSEGELEIGQASALVREVLPAGQIVDDIWAEFQAALSNPLQQQPQ